MKEIIQLDCIDKYNKLYGLETQHPLVAVIDLTQASHIVNHIRMTYGLYALYLKNGVQCTLHYGRQLYDYQEGTIVSFAPGQTVGVDSDEDEMKPEVRGLLFHPDLIYGTPLAEHISQYTFFDYGQTESLHLSETERQMILDLFENTRSELNHPVDRHSQNIIVDRIKLILDYCMRFYDRQFVTRHKANSDILIKFEADLKEYLNSKQTELTGLPTVAYFADRACLSPGYFGDLIKKETGMTAQHHIQQKVIERAKQHIRAGQLTINQIATLLGFQYPQHFIRLFKRETGLTPREYRLS
ncbi:MAG: helix-turn-helix domain-containing protein [Prevotellaceae bacterium]|nr:helix-turn-helix domain-containing protein [Prevotellaceae bacterium]MDY3366221.1 helix-turn-helix domain-containing protein [Prevotella sp.]